MMKNLCPIALEALLARQSLDMPQLPAPSDEVLASILKAGLSAPDHGRIRPWRFVVIKGTQNCAKIGKKTALALRRQNPEIDLKKCGRLERRFAEVPLIIAIGAAFVPDCAIPRKEQEYAVAAGAMNLLNALSFAGFGGIWVSGAYTEDGLLRKELGLCEASEKGGLLGFILAGSIPERMADLPPKKRPSLEEHVLYWPKT